MQDMYDQPRGWYRDPVQPNRHRFWSGRGWIGPVGENLELWCRVLEPFGDGSRATQAE